MEFENEKKLNFEYDSNTTTAMDSDFCYNEDEIVSDIKEIIEYNPNSCWNRFLSCIRSIWATKHTEDTNNNKALYIKTTLRELVIYLLFLVILMIISFGMKTKNEYQYTNMLRNLFTETSFEDKISKFSTAATEDDFWEFISGPLLKGLYWTNLYNNINVPTNERNFIYYENKLIGVPRIRQLRVGNKTCLVPKPFRTKIVECFASYSPLTESKDPYTNSNKSPWTYTKESILNAGSYQGNVASYGGGGYYVDLATTYEESEAIIRNLFKGLWIDRGTRAVIIDFTVYNANINLFCIIRLCIEFPSTGGVLTSNLFNTVKLYRYVSSTDYFILGCEIILIVFLIYYIIEEVLEIRKVKCEYFFSFWNILDILVIIFSVTSSIFNICRTATMRNIIDNLVSNDYQHPNFESLGYWQLQFNYLIAITLFLAWVKIFKYISFNKTMTELSSTLCHCSKDLIGFTIMILIIFIAFALLGYLIFGSQVSDFRDLETSSYTLFRIILGDFDFNQLEMAHIVLGPLYFVFYVFVVFFVLFNMFLAIITTSYSEVKEEMSKLENDFELTDYLKEKTELVLTKLHLKREKIIDLQNAMMNADINKDDVIDFEEWKSKLKVRGHTDIEIETIFARHDVDRNRVLNKAEQELFQKELENEKMRLNAKIMMEKSRNTQGGDELKMKSVSMEEYRALSKRVECMDNNTRYIISYINCFMENLENMEKSKDRSKEAMGIFLKSLASTDDQDEEEWKRNLKELIQEEINKLNQIPLSGTK